MSILLVYAAVLLVAFLPWLVAATEEPTGRTPLDDLTENLSLWH